MSNTNDCQRNLGSGQGRPALSAGELIILREAAAQLDVYVPGQPLNDQLRDLADRLSRRMLAP